MVQNDHMPVPDEALFFVYFSKLCDFLKEPKIIKTQVYDKRNESGIAPPHGGPAKQLFLLDLVSRLLRPQFILYVFLGTFGRLEKGKGWVQRLLEKANGWVWGGFQTFI